MNKSLIRIVTFVGLITLLLFSPVFAVVLALLFFVANIIHAAMSFVSLNTGRSIPLGSGVDSKLFVTVLVPTYNEPSHLVIKTLQSLLNQTYTNFEVIVLDNNTKEKRVWKSVQAFCTKHSKKLRFYHVEGITGYKSGAINHALKYIKDKTDYVLILDSDYALTPDALKLALSYIASKDIALVQFPQSYQNSMQVNEGINLDFRHFFAVYMNMANSFQCVPSTGTVSLMKYSALIDVGGFDTTSITEDAEIGFRFNMRGYKTIYVDKCIGMGMMPLDIESLQKQRYRWSFGNMQIIRRNMFKIIFGKALSFKQRLGFMTHLTAWCNFTTIPVLILFCLSILGIVFPLTSVQIFAMQFAAVSVILYLMEKLILFIVGLRADGFSLKQSLKGFMAHIGLSKVHMFSWVDCLIDDKFCFERTNKFLVDDATRFVKNLFFEIVIGTYLVVLAIMTRDWLVSIGLLLSGFMLLSAIYTYMQSKQTKLVSLMLKDKLSIK